MENNWLQGAVTFGVTGFQFLGGYWVVTGDFWCIIQGVPGARCRLTWFGVSGDAVITAVELTPAGMTDAEWLADKIGPKYEPPP